MLCLYAGGLVLTALVMGLSLVLAPWMAALSVGVLVTLFAAILIGMGRSRLRNVNLKLQKTIEALKEDVQWLKDRPSETY